MIRTTFEFADCDFEEHDYSYTVDLPCLPRAGDSIQLTGETWPLKHGEFEAEEADVEDTKWYLEPLVADGVAATVFCRIRWDAAVAD